MSKQNLLNLGLLGFIAILVLLAVYEPGIEPPAEPSPLLTLDKDDVKSIAIQREEQEDVRLERDARGEWSMTTPIRHPADSYRIDALLRIAEAKSLASFSTGQEQLADYGLDTPRATLTLNDDISVAFGANTPLDHRRYILFDGTVHLIRDTLYYQLIGSFPTFLRKQLLAAGSEIESLQLPGLTLAWHEGRWQLSPQPEDYSADQVTALLDNWRLASALEIRPYDGREGEILRLRLKGEDKPLQLLLTAREPDLILAQPELGIQYHLDAASGDKLLQLPPLAPQTDGSTSTDMHETVDR